MTYDEIKTAMDQAETVMSQAERLAKRAIELSAGRIRKMNLPHWLLSSLKRELSGYNSHKMQWKG